MDFWLGLLLGLLIGWLIEWVIDWFYWRRTLHGTRQRYLGVEADRRRLQTELTDEQERRSALEARLAQLQAQLADKD